MIQSIVTIFVLLIVGIYVLALWILYQRFHKKVHPQNAVSIWFQRIILLATLGITLCILYGYFIEPKTITTTRITLSSDKIGLMSDRNIAKSFRIVHLSDLHMEAESGLVLRVPELVKAERPDVIVLTGDYLNNTKSQDVLKRFLNKLEAPYGVYAIMGNWDGWFSSKKGFEGTSVKILDGEMARVNINGTALEISGAGIPRYHERTPASRHAYRLFLNHTPDLIPEAAQAGFDLYLCGHTHGGQVRLPFYGALITLSRFGKRYEMGHYQEGNMDAYVTRGIGLEPGIITAARFLCPPEIVVIDIVPPE